MSTDEYRKNIANCLPAMHLTILGKSDSHCSGSCSIVPSRMFLKLQKPMQPVKIKKKLGKKLFSLNIVYVFLNTCSNIILIATIYVIVIDGLVISNSAYCAYCNRRLLVLRNNCQWKRTKLKLGVKSKERKINFVQTIKRMK